MEAQVLANILEVFLNNNHTSFETEVYRMKNTQKIREFILKVRNLNKDGLKELLLSLKRKQSSLSLEPYEEVLVVIVDDIIRKDS